MNARFKPQSTRECMEGISAPLSHFATCKYDHHGVYNQAAQSKKFNGTVDASFWSRTSNIWSARVPRENTGSSNSNDVKPTWLLTPRHSSKRLAGFTRSLHMRGAAVAVLVVTALGFYFWPANMQNTSSTTKATADISTPKSNPLAAATRDTSGTGPATELTSNYAAATTYYYTAPQAEQEPTPVVTAPTEPAAIVQPPVEAITAPVAAETPATTTPPDTTTPPTEPSGPDSDKGEVIPPVL